MYKITQAVAYMHNQKPEPIVHRDLKPENILFTSKDIDKADFKIIDFGLSRQYQAD